MNTLVVDIGTSSVRVAIVDECLQILMSKIRKRFAEIVYDAEEEWDIIWLMIKEITTKCKEVDKIVVSSMMGWVGVNSKCNAVTECFTYRHHEEEEYSVFISNPEKNSVHSICGIRVSKEWPVFKLMRIQKHDPELFGKIDKFMSMKDFINMKLTGNKYMDHGTAGYTMLYDVHSKQWSDRMLRITGVNPRVLPKIKEPVELIGEVRESLLKELGILQKVVVAAGTVDGTAGIFGIVGDTQNVGVSLMGTTDVYFAITDKPLLDPDEELITKPYVIPGKWMIGGPMGIFGGTIEWIQKKLAGDKSLTDLNLEAAHVPIGCDGLISFPSFDGERTPFWNTGMKGQFLNLSYNHSVYHMYRSVMEANGFANKYIIDKLNQLSIELKKICVVGGCAKSDLWISIKADITGKKHETFDISESTLIGSALIAQIASGAEGRQSHEFNVKNSFMPNVDHNRKYQKYYLEYMRMHEILAEAYGH